MKLDILAIAAHPDDVELGCSGTLLKHIALGKKVGVIDLTKGELGSRGSGNLRLIEAQNAAKILKLSVRENLNLGDVFFRNTPECQLQIIEMIRKYQPEIVITNPATDRHPDHGRASKIVSEACFYSGLLRIKTTLKGEKQTHWRPKSVYHFIQDRMLEPDFIIDITPYFKTKIEAILAFSSQFYNPNSNASETPISSKDFMQFLDARAREFGRIINTKYGEGFTMERVIGVEDITMLL